jgi:hypothetical protein
MKKTLIATLGGEDDGRPSIETKLEQETFLRRLANMPNVEPPYKKLLNQKADLIEESVRLQRECDRMYFESMMLGTFNLGGHFDDKEQGSGD